MRENDVRTTSESGVKMNDSTTSTMREVDARAITEKVKELLLQANFEIEPEILAALETAREKETSPTGRAVLDQIIENDRLAADSRLAICQDTGMAIVFVELGQEVHITGGDLRQAIDQGVREAYDEGYLRKSVVKDPVFDRTNTGDNTPAIVYTEVVRGSEIRLFVSPKGAGCENMSRSAMLIPADGVEGVKRFVLETIELAGPNTCPPSIVGVGIGGSFDYAAMISKKALLRGCRGSHPDARYAALEKELLDAANALGIGPSGFGGNTTALAVNIEVYPTHIAQVPVAVTMCCHASRHASGVI